MWGRKLWYLIILPEHGLDTGLILYFCICLFKTILYYLCALRIDLCLWLIYSDLIEIVLLRNFNVLRNVICTVLWYACIDDGNHKKYGIPLWHVCLAQKIYAGIFIRCWWHKDLWWIDLGWEAVGIQDEWVCVKILKGQMTLKNQLIKTNWFLGSDKVHISQVIDERVKHQNVLQPFNVFQLTI